MASFDVCLDYAIQNCPILVDKSFKLKDKQLDTLKALYEANDCISVLPTGYGKSIIFHMLPWFAQRLYQRDKPMIVLVVCPLNSIMQDQVLSLRKAGINACTISITGMFCNFGHSCNQVLNICMYYTSCTYTIAAYIVLLCRFKECPLVKAS